jgi:hypothetical protein
MKQLASLVLLASCIFLIGALDCHLEAGNTTCGLGTKVISIQNDTGGYNNAHAQNATINTYSNSICCTEPLSPVINNTCGYAIFRLDDYSNAHVQQNNESTYTYNACLSVTNGNVSCSYVDGGCGSGYTCLASIANGHDDTASNSTNGHVSACGVYTRNVCCTIAPHPVCVNQTGYCFTTIQAAVTNSTAGQTVVITNNATYNEAVTITHDLTITSNSTTGLPTIYVVNATAFTGDYEVNLSFVNINVTGEDGLGVYVSESVITDSVIWLNDSALGMTGYAGPYTLDRVNFTCVSCDKTMDGNGAEWFINHTRIVGDFVNSYMMAFSSYEDSYFENSFINITSTYMMDSAANPTEFWTYRNVTLYVDGSGPGARFRIYDSYINATNDAIFVYNAGSGSTITNSTLVGTVHIQATPEPFNLTIVDTNVTAGTQLDFESDNRTAQNVTVLNSSITPTGTTFSGSAPQGRVFYQKYLDVYVNDTAGAAVVNATVNATDNTSTRAASSNTSSLGMVRQNITYAWKNGTYLITLTNHTVQASKNGYFTTSTTANLSTNQLVNITLGVGTAIDTCSPSNGANWTITGTLSCSNAALNVSIVTINGTLTLTNITLVTTGRTDIGVGGTLKMYNGTTWMNNNFSSNGTVLIDNTTLRMNVTADGQFGIFINRSKTTHVVNQSVITNGDTAAANYRFNVNGSLIVDGSNITKVGIANEGVNVNTNGFASITNATITSDSVGVSTTGAVSIINSTLTGALYALETASGASGVVLHRSSATGAYQTLILNAGSSINITDNVITNIIFIAVTNPLIRNNTITAASGGWGIYMSAGSGRVIYNNTIIVPTSSDAGIGLASTGGGDTFENMTIRGAGKALEFRNTASTGNIFRNITINYTGSGAAVNATEMLNRHTFDNITIYTSATQAVGFGLPLRVSNSSFNRITFVMTGSASTAINITPAENISVSNSTMLSARLNSTMLYVVNITNSNFTNLTYTNTNEIRQALYVRNSTGTYFSALNITQSSGSIGTGIALVNALNANITSSYIDAQSYSIDSLGGDLNGVTVSNSTLNATSGGSSLRLTGSATASVSVINASLLKSIAYGADGTASRNVTLLNSTFNTIDQSACDGTPECTFSVNWYVGAYVANSSGPLTGATVTLLNNTNGTLFSGTTTSGYIAIQNVTEYVVYNNANTTRQNTTINATSPGYAWAVKSRNITSSWQENFTLTGAVCVNETGVCWSTVQAAVDNATSGQTVIITDESNYTEAITINKTVIITSNGTSPATIQKTNASVFTVSSASVTLTLIRLNVSLTSAVSDTHNIRITADNVKIRSTNMNFWTNVNTSFNAVIFENNGGTQGSGWYNITYTNFSSQNGSYALYQSKNPATIDGVRFTGTMRQGALNIYGGDKYLFNIYSNASGGGGTMSGSSATTSIARNVTVTGTSATVLETIAVENSSFTSTASAALVIGNTVLRNATVSGSGICIQHRAGGDTSNSSVVIADTVFATCGTPYYVFATAGYVYNGTIINTSATAANSGSNSCGSNNCTTLFQKYLDVYVNDTSGSGISGATVNVTDITGTRAHSSTTDGTGRIRYNVTYARWNTTTTTNLTNHTILAWKLSYGSNTTTANMSNNNIINLTLLTGTVCVNETGVCWGTVQDAVNNATSGQTVVITSSGTYAENVSVNKDLTITSNSTQNFPVILTSGTAFDSATVQSNLNLSRLNISTTGAADARGVFFRGNLVVSDAIFWLDATAPSGTLGILSENYAGALTMNRVNMTATATSTNADCFYTQVGLSPFTINNTIVNCGMDLYYGGGIIENSIVTSSDVTVAFPTVVRNISITNGTIISGFVGTQNVSLENSYINGTDSATGISVYVSDYANITNSTLFGRIEVYNSANQTRIVDTNVTPNGGDPALRLLGNNGGVANITVLNSSITPATTTNSCPGARVCFVYYQKYLDVYVNDTAGTPISAVTVNSTDNTDALSASSTTGAAGTVRQNITYVWRNQTLWVNLTNHTVLADKNGYTQNSTTVNMTTNQQVNFTMSSGFAYNICDPSDASDWYITVNLTCNNTAINVSIVQITGNLTLQNVTLKAGRTAIFTSSSVKAYNSTIWRNGNLSINGTYLLDNTTMYMNVSTNGEFGIFVNTSAIMRLANSSYVVNGSSARYFFRVNGTLVSDTSNISYAGWSSGDGGIVAPGILLITNTNITSTYYGISPTGSLQLSGSYVSAVTRGIDTIAPVGISIRNSTIYVPGTSEIAISLSSGSSYNITDNYVVGVISMSALSGLTFRNNTIASVSSACGISLGTGSGRTFSNTTIIVNSSSSLGGLCLQSSTTSAGDTFENFTIIGIGTGIAIRNQFQDRDTFKNFLINLTGSQPAINFSIAANRMVFDNFTIYTSSTGTTGVAGRSVIVENTSFNRFTFGMNNQNSTGFNLTTTTNITIANSTLLNAPVNNTFIYLVNSTNSALANLTYATSNAQRQSIYILNSTDVLITTLNITQSSGSYGAGIAAPNAARMNVTSSYIDAQQYAIDSSGSDLAGVTVYSSTLNATSGGNSLRLTGSPSAQVSIINSTLLKSINYGADGTASRNVTLLNSTFNTVDQSACDGSPECTFSVNWYVGAYVENTTGAVSGATVTMENNTNGLLFSGSTASSGLIAIQNITEYVVYNGVNATRQNTTINASGSGLSLLSRSRNITSNWQENFTLSGSVCINETGVCWSTIQAAVNNATTGQTIVITDSGTYYENVTLNKTVNIRSNGSGMPTIYGLSTPAFTVSGTRTLDISGVNISVSSSSTNVHAIDVPNGAFLTLRAHEMVFWMDSNASEAALIYDNFASASSYNLTNVNMSIVNGTTGMWIYSSSAILDSVRLTGTVTTVFGLHSTARNKTVTNTFVNVTGGLGTINGIYASSIVSNLTAYATAASNQGGLSVESIVVENSTISINGDVTGVSTYSQVLLKNSTVTGPTYCVKTFGTGSTANVSTVIIDSTIRSCTNLLYVTAAAAGNTYNTTIINSTITPTNVSGQFSTSCDTRCRVYFNNWLDVYVNDTAGVAISGATVNATDSTSTRATSSTTSGSGTVRQNVTYNWMNSSANTTLTNHTILAWKVNYRSNSTSVNMSSNQQVNFTLLPGTVCVNETGVCWERVQEAVTNATTGQTAVITNDALYVESVTISKTMALTSNSSVQPTVRALSGSTITLNGANTFVNISNINISINTTVTDTHAIRLTDSRVTLRVTDTNFYVNSTTSPNGAIYEEIGSGVARGVFNITRVNVTAVSASVAFSQSSGNATFDTVRVTGTVTNAFSGGWDRYVFNTFVNVTGSAGTLSGSNGAYLASKVRNLTVYAGPSGCCGTAVVASDITIEESSVTEWGDSKAFTIIGNVLLRNVSMAVPSVCIEVGAGSAASANLTLVDSVMYNCTNKLLTSTVADHNYTSLIINSTPTPSMYGMGGPCNTGCRADFANYLDVYVTDITGAAISDVTINSTDNTATVAKSSITGADGRLRQNVTYAWRNLTQWVNLSNHTVLANKNGYTDNSTSVNFSANQQVNFTLYSGYVYNTCSPTAGSDWFITTNLTCNNTGINVSIVEISGNLTLQNVTLNAKRTSVYRGASMKSYNSTIWRNGNLSINGTYLLDNTTMYMNTSADGQFGIFVNTSASMNIVNNSAIVNGSSSHYWFTINGTAAVDTSNISKAGWLNGQEFTIGGTITLTNARIVSDTSGLRSVSGGVIRLFGSSITAVNRGIDIGSNAGTSVVASTIYVPSSTGANGNIQHTLLVAGGAVNITDNILIGEAQFNGVGGIIWRNNTVYVNGNNDGGIYVNSGSGRVFANTTFIVNTTSTSAGAIKISANDLPTTGDTYENITINSIGSGILLYNGPLDFETFRNFQVNITGERPAINITAVTGSVVFDNFTIYTSSLRATGVSASRDILLQNTSFNRFTFGMYGGNSTAFNITNATNVTIANSTLLNAPGNATFVYLRNVTNSALSNLTYTTSNAQRQAIYLLNTTNIALTTINITQSAGGAGTGIGMPNTTKTNITNSFIDAQSYALDSSASYTTGITVYSSTLNASTGGASIRLANSESASVTVVNSTLLKEIAYGADGTASRNVTLLNSTFNAIDQSACDGSPECTFSVQWYLGAYVANLSGPVDGATITIENNTNETVFSGATAANGYITIQNITEYVVYNGVNASQQSTTINASGSGYALQSRIRNITSSWQENFSLLAPVCINETGVCWRTIQEAVDNATEGQTVVITDASTYIESVNITKNLNIRSNGTGLPTLLGNNTTAIYLNLSVELNISGINISVTGNNSPQAISSGSGFDPYWLNLTDAIIWLDQNVSSSAIGGAYVATVYIDRVNFTATNTSVARALSLHSSYVGINNTRINTTFEGIYLSGAASGYIENSDVNVTNGDAIFASGLVLRNVTVTANGSDDGLVLGGSTTVYDSAIYGGAGINSLGDDTSVYRSVVSSVYAYSSANRTRFVDTVIISSITLPLDGADKNMTFLNTTTPPIDVGCASSVICELYIQNYMDVYVNYTNGSAVNETTVNATDNTSTLAFSVLTGEDGFIVRQNVTYLFTNYTVNTTLTNHTVRANHSTLGSALTSANMSTYQLVNLTLIYDAPSVPTLISPANNTAVFNRFTPFNWSVTDAQGDPITSYWNISAPAGCAALPEKAIGVFNYTSTDKLCLDREYNWTVKACDPFNCSSYAAPFNFSIPSVAGVTFVNATVDFGAMIEGQSAHTLSNNPRPFRYNNTGNVDVNISTKADAALWLAQPLNTTYFMYGDENSSVWKNWTASYTALFGNLSYQSPVRELEVNVTAPLGEGGGSKLVSVTVLATSIE